jgi:hypothetical protein
MKVTVEFEGLSEYAELFRRMPAVANKAARIAINQVAQRGAIKLARDSILDEINFPKNYLYGDRLSVTRKATDSSLEAVITGRKMATSLARFAAGGTAIGSTTRQGVTVKVKTRGAAVHLRKAWLVRLRSDKSLTEDKYNIGLAVRVRPGDKIRGKYSQHFRWLVKGTVALLYGPSVDQVFREVADKIAPKVADMTADEFERQFTRLTS